VSQPTRGGLWIVCLVLVVGATASCGRNLPVSQGEAVAERIRDSGSPLLERVDFRPGNLLDDLEVVVWLRSDVTQQQADEFWCEVVLPAGGSDWGDADLDPTRLVPVSVFTADDVRRLDSDPACP
jgi:hypothetical protein